MRGASKNYRLVACETGDSFDGGEHSGAVPGGRALVLSGLYMYSYVAVHIFICIYVHMYHRFLFIYSCMNTFIYIHIYTCMNAGDPVDGGEHGGALPGGRALALPGRRVPPHAPRDGGGPFDPDPTLCTLHPAPCTLHPAPCTLHPTSCTLHPSPRTPHPAPCTLHPESCTLHPTLHAP